MGMRVWYIHDKKLEDFITSFENMTLTNMIEMWADLDERWYVASV